MCQRIIASPAGWSKPGSCLQPGRSFACLLLVKGGLEPQHISEVGNWQQLLSLPLCLPWQQCSFTSVQMRAGFGSLLLMLNQYCHFQFSYDESHFIYLSRKSELILSLYPQMLVMKHLFCTVTQQELLFLAVLYICPKLCGIFGKQCS